MVRQGEDKIQMMGLRPPQTSPPIGSSEAVITAIDW